MKKIIRKLSKLSMSSNTVSEKNCIISYFKWPKTSKIGYDMFCSTFPV